MTAATTTVVGRVRVMAMHCRTMCTTMMRVSMVMARMETTSLDFTGCAGTMVNGSHRVVTVIRGVVESFLLSKYSLSYYITHTVICLPQPIRPFQELNEKVTTTML